MAENQDRLLEVVELTGGKKRLVFLDQENAVLAGDVGSGSREGFRARPSSEA
jgi:hypothetical protein